MCVGALRALNLSLHASISSQVNIEQYKQAHLAHIQGKTYVRVTGLLNPGNQPRKLTEIESFSLVENK